jgi:hypothetical protein
MKYLFSKLGSIFKNDSGQAMAEMVIISPVLIMLYWGVAYLHTAAFFKARAEMAARHTAWIQSVKKSASYASAQGTNVLFEYGQPNGVVANVTCSGKAGLLIQIGESNSALEAIATAMNNLFSFGPGWMGDIMRAFPIVQPFICNAESTVQLGVIPTYLPLIDEDVPFSDTTRGYFAVRWKSLYFHNSWDFFPSGMGPSDLDSTRGDASSQIEDQIKDFESTLKDHEDQVDQDQWVKYQDALKRWREWRNQWP